MVATKAAASEHTKFEQFLSLATPIITEETNRGHARRPANELEDLQQAARSYLWERRRKLYRVGAKERGHVWPFVRKLVRDSVEDELRTGRRLDGEEQGYQIIRTSELTPSA